MSHIAGTFFRDIGGFARDNWILGALSICRFPNEPKALTYVMNTTLVATSAIAVLQLCMTSNKITATKLVSSTISLAFLGACNYVRFK